MAHSPFYSTCLPHRHSWLHCLGWNVGPIIICNMFLIWNCSLMTKLDISLIATICNTSGQKRRWLLCSGLCDWLFYDVLTESYLWLHHVRCYARLAQVATPARLCLWISVDPSEIEFFTQTPVCSDFFFFQIKLSWIVVKKVSVFLDFALRLPAAGLKKSVSLNAEIVGVEIIIDHRDDSFFT